MALTITIDLDGAKTVIAVTPEDMLALENDLADVPAWIAAAIAGKINQTKKRMIQQAVAALRGADVAVPASDADAINAAVALPAYRNRATRDAAGP